MNIDFKTDNIKRIENHGLVLYDGHCEFCLFWIHFILKNDSHSYFLFAPLQSHWIKTLKFPLPKGIHSILLYENKSIYNKSTAILKIAKHLNHPWKWLYIFSFIPLFIRNYIYDLIAKNRYRFLTKIPDTIPDHEKHKFFLN